MTSVDLIRINKDFFIKAASISAKTAVFAALPYLSTPPFGMIIGKFIDWIIGKIADSLELAAYFEYVDLRTVKQGDDYVSAAHKANQTNSPGDIQIANDKFKLLVKLGSI
jgi:hypothetical protein